MDHMKAAARARPRNASEARDWEQEIADDQARRETRSNRHFVQVYGLGWRRLRSLMQTHPSAARLYALLAEHIDGGGVVVATQDVLAEILGVSVKTVQRHSAVLEDARAMVRIQIQGGVYAYALNPEEVWKAYNKAKTYAAFHSKTLVSRRGSAADLVERRLTVMLREVRGEPELPLEDTHSAIGIEAEEEAG